MKKKKSKKRNVKFYDKKTLRALKKTTSFKQSSKKAAGYTTRVEGKDAYFGGHVPMSYKFNYAITPPPVKATLGEYKDFVNISSVIGWKKKNWVPFWIWKLVADGKFIGDEQHASI